MPYLKSKVSRALDKAHHQSSPAQDVKIEETESSSQSACKKEEIPSPQQTVGFKPFPKSVPKTKVEPSSKKSPQSFQASKKDIQSNKNIVKNYARAMVNFAVSTHALPYLDKILQDEEDVNLNDFRMYMQERKEDITSIKNLRELLLINDDDEEQVVAFKRIFRATCVVFIKFFSVNWIYSSKVGDKITHVRYRFKILRRVRNPEHFTYLENFSKTK